jgi:hypothetical protein
VNNEHVAYPAEALEVATKSVAMALSILSKCVFR